MKIANQFESCFVVYFTICKDFNTDDIDQGNSIVGRDKKLLWSFLKSVLLFKKVCSGSYFELEIRRVVRSVFFIVHIFKIHSSSCITAAERDSHLCALFCFGVHLEILIVGILRPSCSSCFFAWRTAKAFVFVLVAHLEGQYEAAIFGTIAATLFYKKRATLEFYYIKVQLTYPLIMEVTRYIVALRCIVLLHQVSF